MESITNKNISFLKNWRGATSGLHTHLGTAHAIILIRNVDADCQSQRAITFTVIKSFAAVTEDETPKKRSKLTYYSLCY